MKSYTLIYAILQLSLQAYSLPRQQPQQSGFFEYNTLDILGKPLKLKVRCDTSTDSPKVPDVRISAIQLESLPDQQFPKTNGVWFNVQQGNSGTSAVRYQTDDALNVRYVNLALKALIERCVVREYDRVEGRVQIPSIGPWAEVNVYRAGDPRYQ